MSLLHDEVNVGLDEELGQEDRLFAAGHGQPDFGSGGGVHVDLSPAHPLDLFHLGRDSSRGPKFHRHRHLPRRLLLPCPVAPSASGTLGLADGGHQGQGVHVVWGTRV